MAKVVALGEMLMRLSPPGFQRLVQTSDFKVIYGGSEANVMISLAQMGVDTAYVTRLPDQPLGEAACNTLRRWGVDTRYVVRGDGRMGIYYLEQGAAIRASNVYYDRAGSAMAQARSEMFDWDKILQGAQWLHFSGITPALSENCAEITMQALQKAKAMGLKVCCDLNYRAKLWSVEQCRRVMIPMMPYVDVVMGTSEDADDVLDIQLPPMGMREASEAAAREIHRRFGIKMAAMMQRESRSVIEKGWSAVLYDDGKVYDSQHYELHTVDIVGTGDAFAAGLLYGLMSGRGPQFTLNYALAASALKQTMEGDFNLATAREILPLAETDGFQDIKR
jgi:2-dehydro-3-deoxygluconokinase